MPKNIITIEKLFKRYPGATYNSLNGLSFNVSEGDFFGLLGPNGCGKTTLISILCGLLQASDGAVSIQHHPIPKELNKIKHLIGLVPQEIALYPSLTLKENMRYFGQLYGMKTALLNDRIEYLSERVGLSAFLNKTIQSYSGGMKRRANLITGLLHQPKILFVDEATANVDPQSRQMIFQVLNELNQTGITIVYTSHYMEEIEALCKTVAIIDRGELISYDSPQSLIQKNPGCKDLGEVFLHLTGHALRDEALC